MAQTADPKAYYGYLFESDKKPTKVLDALLRGIANYIIDSVGNKDDKYLTPAKLATFYKAVGGNYDSLFVDMPYPSISWIYASIGCQHTLQPTKDDFSPPSIPALTLRGFVRWQSIEILLGPEEHVPFIQNAVRNFAIKNPDNGETFPVELPAEAFPLTADTEIEKWHNNCAERLRQRATSTDEEPSLRPDLPPRPKVQGAYAHVRPPARTSAAEYFEPKSRGGTQRPIPYQHVSAAGPTSRPLRPGLSHSPAHRAHQFLAPEMPPSSPHLSRGRRRSFPENVSSPSPPDIGSPQPDLRPPQYQRRHSHPRHARRGSVSSDASSSSEGGEEPPSPATVRDVGGVQGRRKSYPHARDEPPSIRYAPPTPVIPTGGAPPPSDQTRARQRISRDRAAAALSTEEDEESARMRSPHIPIDLTGKLSAPFLLGNRDRARRNDSPRANTVTWKDLSGVNGDWRRGSRSSEEDREMKAARRKESDREREKDSAGSSGSRRRRDLDREVVDPVRPVLKERRYSSHEDGLRRHRDRDRDHDYDRDRDREPAGRAVLRDRERERDRERRAPSPIRVVDGRKYPPLR